MFCHTYSVWEADTEKHLMRLRKSAKEAEKRFWIFLSYVSAILLMKGGDAYEHTTRKSRT
jgi:hypothetical protein